MGKDIAGLVMEFHGPREGIDAWSAWKARGAHGVSRITASEADRRVVYIVNAKPGEFHAEGTIVLTPVAGGTEVYWRYGGNMGSNPLFKLWMLGYIREIKGGFDKGLHKLKWLSETPGAATPPVPAALQG